MIKGKVDVIPMANRFVLTAHDAFYRFRLRCRVTSSESSTGIDQQQSYPVVSPLQDSQLLLY